nr:hypothetical protein BaRGS_024453 [Batillaria attramentaria]
MMRDSLRCLLHGADADARVHRAYVYLAQISSPCAVFQEYVDCILQDACPSLSDELKQEIESELRKEMIDCNLNIGDENGGSGGLANIPYYLPMFLAAFGTLLAR